MEKTGIKGKRMAKQYTTPAYIENIKLFYPLLFMCEYLSLNDLENLSLASEFLDNIVQAFYRKKCEVLEKIVLRNTNLKFYLESERPLDDDLSDRSPMKKFALNRKWSRLCRRSLDVNDFYFVEPRLRRGLPYYEHETLFDNRIERPILHLIRVFSLELNVEFKDVQKGKYVLKIRINLENFREINSVSRGKDIFATWEDENGSHCASDTIRNDVFKALKGRLKRNKGGVTKSGINCFACNFDEVSGFFDLVLVGINVANNCSVKCYLEDRDAVHLKDIKFDYIELMPVCL